MIMATKHRSSTIVRVEAAPGLFRYERNNSSIATLAHRSWYAAKPWVLMWVDMLGFDQEARFETKRSAEAWLKKSVGRKL